MEKLSPEAQKEFDALCQDNDDGTVLDGLREVTEEDTFRMQGETCRTYEPNGKCEEFIKLVGDGKHFVVLFSAANGVGKTAAGANIVANIVFGQQYTENKYFDFPLYKEFPYRKRGRIISDATNVEKNLIPTLKEWLPEGRYTTKKGRKTYEASWESDTGFEWDIMTYDQDVKEFEAATLGWAWFDEPPSEAIFKATVARMRKGGVIFISATPLKGSAWLYDHIIANPDKELMESGQRAYVEADVEDACKQHGVRGHLEHEHIQKMIAEYSEDEKQARVHGKFQHLIGLRFKLFSRNIHVIKPFNIDLRNFSVYEALDTHGRTNDMGIWIAVDRENRKFIIDELWIKCQGGTEELATRIKKVATQYRVIRRILEPAAFNKDQHDETGKSLAEKLESYGLFYLPATKVRTQSDKRIEDALTYSKVNLGDREEYIKTPELFIFETCIRTIFEFEHYSWDDWTGRTAEKKGLKEKTIDKDDHAIECIGRILIQEPKFVEIPTANDEGEEYDPDPYDH